jgi:D-alanyl-D-alanine dipeptidase
VHSLILSLFVSGSAFAFVDVRAVNSDIFVETAYAGSWNFIGKRIDGYNENKCYLTAKAAKALSEVQKDVAKLGYGLLVFDCYRPQGAVNQFVKWTKDLADTRMQAQFYPELAKTELLGRYIGERSGHSRGGTVDLTLVKRGQFKSKVYNLRKTEIRDCRVSAAVQSFGLVDMGTTFDCFNELAHTANPDIPAEIRRNRKILKSAMERRGFKNYSKEWWHYTLNTDPQANDYFDFEIQ